MAASMSGHGIRVVSTASGCCLSIIMSKRERKKSSVAIDRAPPKVPRTATQCIGSGDF
jgi:hypothetical protein